MKQSQAIILARLDAIEAALLKPRREPTLDPSIHKVTPAVSTREELERAFIDASERYLKLVTENDVR